MKKPPLAERRRAPRAEKRLTLQLSGANFDLTTETKNISARGVYCRVDRHIPFMTKLKVALLLPGGKGGGAKTQAIRCQAIVVRSESQKIDNRDERHFVALYFERLSQLNRQRLERHVRATLAAAPIVSKR